MSLCLDCNLFTIKERPVKENKYVYIFSMWLSAVLKYGGLCRTDLLHLKIDSDTFEYLKTQPACNGLMQTSICPIKIILYPPPETIRDGMAMRYVKVNHMQDVYMYCDIDILMIKPLRPLYESLPINTISVHVEGQLSDDNYGAAFTAEEKSKLSPLLPGFSSGKFIIYGNELYSQFVDMMMMMHALNNETYFTIDQPLFNKVIYLLSKDPNCLKIIPSTFISCNGHSFTKDCILLDAMGMAGDGDIHFDKILNFFILLQSGGLEAMYFKRA
jgi:hypothetical protein